MILRVSLQVIEHIPQGRPLGYGVAQQKLIDSCHFACLFLLQRDRDHPHCKHRGMIFGCKMSTAKFFLVEFMGCYEYTNPNDEPFWHHDLQCQDSHHLCSGRQKQLEESELLLIVNSIFLNGYGSLGCQLVPRSLQSIILHMSHMIRRTEGPSQKWRNQNLHWLQNYITHCWCWC